MRSIDRILAPAYPAKIIELLPHYRQHGMAIPRERRSLFERLMAASEVTREPSDNPRDTDLCVELLRLGKEYGLLQ